MAVKRDGYNQEYYQRNKEVILARSRERYYAKREEIRQQRREHYADDDNYLSYMLDRCRSRASGKGIEFSITLADLVVPELCPVLGIPLKRNKGKGRAAANSPSVDRIDPTQGYVPGNVQVMSYKANCMKNNASPEELLAFADWVNRTYEDPTL